MIVSNVKRPYALRNRHHNRKKKNIVFEPGDII